MIEGEFILVQLWELVVFNYACMGENLIMLLSNEWLKHLCILRARAQAHSAFRIHWSHNRIMKRNILGCFCSFPFISSLLLFYVWCEQLLSTATTMYIVSVGVRVLEYKYRRQGTRNEQMFGVQRSAF